MGLSNDLSCEAGVLGLLHSPPFARFIYSRMWDLGVLPTAQPAPLSATLSPALSVYLCANVGPQGLLVVRLPALFVPHSASLGPATACLLYTSDAADDTCVV